LSFTSPRKENLSLSTKVVAAIAFNTESKTDERSFYRYNSTNLFTFLYVYYLLPYKESVVNMHF
jgi:hypothetical protein